MLLKLEHHYEEASPAFINLEISWRSLSDASVDSSPLNLSSSLFWSFIMELQSATSGLPGPLSPGPLSSPTSDYAGPLSPSGGPGPSQGASPGRGPSPSLSPIRGPSPGPGFSGQAAFNYNQLEGRFKQLQGKTGAQPDRKLRRSFWMSCTCILQLVCSFLYWEALVCFPDSHIKGVKH